MIELDDLKAVMEITDTESDTLLDRLIKVAQTVIENYCKRTFTEGQFTEECKGSGTQYLNLKHYPISTLTKVYENVNFIADPIWNDITADTFLETESGQVYLHRGFYDKERHYKVQYKAGYKNDKIPEDIKQACIDIITYLYQNRKSQGLKSEQLGEYNYTKADLTGNIIRDLGLNVFLDPYRTPTL
jgi:hypothetical protein